MNIKKLAITLPSFNAPNAIGWNPIAFKLLKKFNLSVYISEIDNPTEIDQFNDQIKSLEIKVQFIRSNEDLSDSEGLIALHQISENTIPTEYKGLKIGALTGPYEENWLEQIKTCNALGIRHIISEVLPDELPSVISSADLNYFRKTFFYLPPVLDFDAIQSNQDEHQIYITHNKPFHNILRNSIEFIESENTNHALHNHLEIIKKTGSFDTSDFNSINSNFTEEIVKKINASAIVFNIVKYPQLSLMLKALCQAKGLLFDELPMENSQLRDTGFNLISQEEQSFETTKESIRSKFSSITKMKNTAKPSINNNINEKMFSVDFITNRLVAFIEEPESLKSEFTLIYDTCYKLDKNGSNEFPLTKQNGTTTRLQFFDWTNNPSTNHAIISATTNDQFDFGYHKKTIENIAIRILNQRITAKTTNIFKGFLNKYNLEWIKVCRDILQRNPNFMFSTQGSHTRLAEFIYYSLCNNSTFEGELRQECINEAIEVCNNETCKNIDEIYYSRAILAKLFAFLGEDELANKVLIETRSQEKKSDVDLGKFLIQVKRAWETELVAPGFREFATEQNQIIYDIFSDYTPTNTTSKQLLHVYKLHTLPFLNQTDKAYESIKDGIACNLTHPKSYAFLGLYSSILGKNIELTKEILSNINISKLADRDALYTLTSYLLLNDNDNANKAISQLISRSQTYLHLSVFHFPEALTSSIILNMINDPVLSNKCLEQLYSFSYTYDAKYEDIRRKPKNQQRKFPDVLKNKIKLFFT